MQRTHSHGLRWTPLVQHPAAAQVGGKAVRHGRFAPPGGQRHNRSHIVMRKTMRHPTFEFRELFLIHSLQRLADGSYIALNRRY